MPVTVTAYWDFFLTKKIGLRTGLSAILLFILVVKSGQPFDYIHFVYLHHSYFVNFLLYYCFFVYFCLAYILFAYCYYYFAAILFLFILFIGNHISSVCWVFLPIILNYGNREKCRERWIHALRALALSEHNQPLILLFIYNNCYYKVTVHD